MEQECLELPKITKTMKENQRWLNTQPSSIIELTEILKDKNTCLALGAVHILRQPPEGGGGGQANADDC